MIQELKKFLIDDRKKSIISRLTTSFNIWVMKQKLKDRCGLFPYQLPSWFTFTDCCSSHDLAYIVLRTEVLQKLVINNVSFVDSLSIIHSYRPYIKEADNSFFYCMHELTEAKSGLYRYFLRKVENVFKNIVDDIGFKVWVNGTIEAYQDMLEGRVNV